MIFFVIILWTVTIITFLNRKGNAYMIWGAATSFVGGLDAFGFILIETVLPMLEGRVATPVYIYLEAICQWEFILGNVLNILFIPTFFLLFCITYSRGRINVVYKCLIVVPSVLTLVYTAITNPIYPKVHYNFILIDIWVVPFIVIGFLLLISHNPRESDYLKRLYHSTFLLLGVSLIFRMVSLYILGALGILGVFRYDIVLTAVLLPVFISLISKSGFFGFRLSVQKRNIEHSIKLASSGNMILLHALKNKLLINLASLSSIKTDYKNSDKVIPDEFLIIENTSNQMLSMLMRIHQQTKDLILIKENHCINKIISDVLLILDPSIRSKKVRVSLNLQSNIYFYCDATHIQEAFYNLIKNSIESMGTDGEIHIQVELEEKTLLISIMDNGCGIPSSNLAKIFQPFFTTKSFSLNFGLGLSYCYQVIHKHNGSIHIDSIQNKGTTVYLTFPIQNKQRVGIWRKSE